MLPGQLAEGTQRQNPNPASQAKSIWGISQALPEVDHLSRCGRAKGQNIPSHSSV